MGRPKGSKNKSKEVQPVLPAVDTKTKVAKKEKVEKDAVKDPLELLRATTNLAVLAGRNFIVDKITTWKDSFKAQDGLVIKVVSTDDCDEYQLWDGDEKLDSKHIFRVDVEDVVAGVLGVR